MSKLRPLKMLIPRDTSSSTQEGGFNSGEGPSIKAHCESEKVSKLIGKSSKPEKAKRKHHSKSLTGCITCKTRRVKCDEVKPECKRCAVFGLPCGGYLNLDRKPTLPPRPPKAALLPRPHYAPSLLPTLSELVGTPEEKACFDFFRRETSSRLSGHFDEGFWTNLLLQIGHTEPIIWHSILALSKLHEQYTLLYVQRGVHNSNRGRRFALQHYNTSVAGLKGVLSASKSSIEIISVNCILFTSLELLLGNTEGAMAHVRCGTQILRRWQEERLKSTSEAPYSELMDRYVIPVFGHMNLHASIMYGTPTLPHIERLRVRKSRRYNGFRDLVEARAILLDIENEGIELANHPSSLLANPQTAKTAFLQKQSLLARSREWEKALDALLSKPSMQYLNLQNSQKVALLKVQHKTAAIWIANSLNTDETSFDKYVVQFEVIISLAESTFERELELLKGVEYADFSVHMQFISLYYITIKCRKPSIRRRALTLLKQASRTEGFWDSKMVIWVAKRVIEIEEESLDCQKDPTGLVVPSEWSRVSSVAVTLETVENSRKAFVRFGQRQNGDKRQWLVREEHFEG